MATSVLTMTTAPTTMMTTTTTTTRPHPNIPISTTTTTTTITVKGEDTTLTRPHHDPNPNSNHKLINHNTNDTNHGKSTPLSFLSLPPEVRNEIYTHLFTDAKLSLGGNTAHPSSSSTTTTSRSRPPCGSFCSCAFPRGIVYTCRLIRGETASLLLSATTLEVTSRIEKLALLPGLFTGLISRVVVLDAKVLNCGVGGGSTSSSSVVSVSASSVSGGGEVGGKGWGRSKGGGGGGGGGSIELERFTALRELEVRNISVWCQYYEESYLETAAADECMFNLAMFNLRRIGMGVVRLREDETRAFRILLGCQFVGNSTRHETVQAVLDVDTQAILQKSKGATIRSRHAWAGFY